LADKGADLEKIDSRSRSPILVGKKTERERERERET